MAFGIPVQQLVLLDLFVVPVLGCFLEVISARFSVTQEGGVLPHDDFRATFLVPVNDKQIQQHAQ